MAFVATSVAQTQSVLVIDDELKIGELSNVVEHAALLSEDVTLGIETLPEELRTIRQVEPIETVPVRLEGNLKVIQRHVLLEVLRRCNGNKAAAARTPGLHRRTLYRMLEKDGN